MSLGTYCSVLWYSGRHHHHYHHLHYHHHISLSRFDKIPDVDHVAPLRGYSPDRTRSPPSGDRNSTSERDDDGYSLLTTMLEADRAADQDGDKPVGDDEKVDNDSDEVGVNKKIALLSIDGDDDVAVMQQLLLKSPGLGEQLVGQVSPSSGTKQQVDEFDETKAY